MGTLVDMPDDAVARLDRLAQRDAPSRAADVRHALQRDPDEKASNRRIARAKQGRTWPVPLRRVVMPRASR
jgi:predicted transcriptional regulator